MKKQQAFTLIELMIAVVIVGILAAIAYPSYRDSVYKSHRADAKAALQNLSNAMERQFTQTNSYCDVGGANGSAFTNCGTSANDTGTASIYTVPTSTANFYTVTIVSPTGISPSAKTASGYILQAAPQGVQSNDSCGTLCLNSTGLRGTMDANGVCQANTGCW